MSSPVVTWRVVCFNAHGTTVLRLRSQRSSNFTDFIPSRPCVGVGVVWESEVGLVRESEVGVVWECCSVEEGSI